MRLKNHWFRPGAKTPEAIASAAAFMTWRIAQDALKTMRAAGYDLPPGGRYFAFVAEFLLFLALGADRLAHARGDEPWRVAFTTAFVRRVGEILAENESYLLGADTVGDVRRRFVDLFNQCAAECAGFDWTDAGPDYAFLRFFGHRVAAVMDDRDGTWAVAQVIEVQGPDAAALLHRAIGGLLDPSPRPARSHAAGD